MLRLPTQCGNALIFPLGMLLAAAGQCPGASISGSQPPGASTGGQQQHAANVPHLQANAPAIAHFSDFVLLSLKDMPAGGGYSTKSQASKNLSTKALVWDEAGRRLRVNVQAAQPSFCSEACYMVLVHALELWQSQASRKLPTNAWKALCVHGQADGVAVWGRANANGPGFAKLVHDLGAGRNFEDIRIARPGDFLKFFWTDEIGCRERGHMVVFLGTEQVEGKLHIRYWSSNVPEGYSRRSVPIDKMHHLIFTRITKPEMFAGAAELAPKDAWLADMQKRSVPFSEVCQTCGVISREEADRLFQGKPGAAGSPNGHAGAQPVK